MILECVTVHQIVLSATPIMDFAQNVKALMTLSQMVNVVDVTLIASHVSIMLKNALHAMITMSLNQIQRLASAQLISPFTQIKKLLHVNLASITVKSVSMAFHAILAVQTMFLVPYNVFRAHSQVTLSMETAVILVLITTQTVTQKMECVQFVLTLFI